MTRPAPRWHCFRTLGGNGGADVGLKVGKAGRAETAERCRAAAVAALRRHVSHNDAEGYFRTWRELRVPRDLVDEGALGLGEIAVKKTGRKKQKGQQIHRHYYAQYPWSCMEAGTCCGYYGLTTGSKGDYGLTIGSNGPGLGQAIAFMFFLVFMARHESLVWIRILCRPQSRLACKSEWLAEPRRNAFVLPPLLSKSGWFSSPEPVSALRHAWQSAIPPAVPP